MRGGQEGIQERERPGKSENRGGKKIVIRVYLRKGGSWTEGGALERDTLSRKRNRIPGKLIREVASTKKKIKKDEKGGGSLLGSECRRQKSYHQGGGASKRARGVHK